MVWMLLITKKRTSMGKRNTETIEPGTFAVYPRTV